MAKLDANEKALAKALLERRQIERDDLEKAIARLRAKRERGSSSRLEDVIVRKGYAREPDVVAIAGPLRKRDSERSVSVTRERGRSTRSRRQSARHSSKPRRQSARRPTVGGFQLEESLTQDGTSPAPLLPNGKPAVGGFQLEDSLTQDHHADAEAALAELRKRASPRISERLGEVAQLPGEGSAESVGHDGETIAIDTARAAEAAILHIQAREQAEREQARLAAHRRKRNLRRGLIAGAASFILPALVWGGLQLSGEAEAPPDTRPPERPPSAVVDEGPQREAHIARAKLLEKGESYIDARQIWRDLLHDDAHPLDEATRATAIQEMERLGALEAFKERIDEALPGVRQLRREGRYPEAVGRLSAVLESHSGLTRSPTGRRIELLIAELLELSNARSTGGETLPRPSPFREGQPASDPGDDPDDPKGPEGGAKEEPKDPQVEARPYALGPEPESRQRRFEALSERGQKVIAELDLRIAAQKSVKEARIAAEAERVIKATEEKPLELAITESYVLHEARVTKYSERGFTLRSRTGEISFRWEAADPRVALQLRSLAARGNALSEMSLGRFCIEQRMFESARRAYARALRIDSQLRSEVPDVDALERETRIFQGDFQRLGGGLVEIGYDFSDREQLRDFDLDVKAGIKEGRLEIQGERVFAAVLRNLVFRDTAEVSFSPRGASRKALIAGGFVEAGRHAGRRGVLLGFQPTTLGLALLLWEAGGTTALEKPIRLPRTPKTLELELSGETLRVRADGKRVLQSSFSPKEGGLRAVFAGVSRETDLVTFSAASAKGDVGPTWLRKTFGAADARLRAAMANAEALPIFDCPATPQPAPPPLSAEDEYGLSDLSPEERKRYADCVAKLSSDGVREFVEAMSELRQLVAERPGFAAGHHRLALGAWRLGKRAEAREQVALAAQSCPSFYEAMATSAEWLADSGDEAQAREWATRALAIRPDWAAGRYALGRALFLSGDLPQALIELERAVALDPWNEDARGLRRNIEHVIAGPPWERTFVHETEHYRVETDISRSKATVYARQLEAIREYYCVQFGLDARTFGAGRKARVLIFDTREGFHSYAQLTTDDRVESFLGYFHPRYRQLLLYEDRRDTDGQETLRVLYHEGFHQFTYSFVPDLPFWLSEGMAEYYAGTRIDDGRIVARGLLHQGRLRDLSAYLSRRPPIGFLEIMSQSPSEFYSGAVAVKYAQAWSMVHFFLHGPQPAAKEALRRYFQALRGGKSNDEALAESFQHLDVAALERGWTEYLRKLR